MTDQNLAERLQRAVSYTEIVELLARYATRSTAETGMGSTACSHPMPPLTRRVSVTTLLDGLAHIKRPHGSTTPATLRLT